MLRRGTGRSPYADTEERLQRALQENAQLKSQKNDLEEKLKKVQTQFRRLAADWRQAQEGHSGHATPSSAHLTRGGPPPLPSSSSSLVAPASARPNSAGAAVALSPATAAAASSSSARNVLPSLPTNQRGAGSRSPSITATPVKHASASISRTGDHNPNLAVGPARAVSEAELAACKAALAHAQLEVQQLRSAVAQAQAQAQMAATAAAANTSASTDASALAAAQAEAAGLRTQLQQVREELNKSLFTQQQLQRQVSQLPEGLLRQMQGGNAAQQQQQQLETQLRASIDTLTREKQELSLKLRLMEVDKQALESAAAVAAAGHNGSPDPADVDAVQAELHRKATEVTLLNSRLQYAQGQVETLRGECGRLVEELKQATTAHGDTKKALFALEHEAAALRAKASTLDEVEAALQKKNEENAHLEEELLKLVGSLQSCNRETEAAVRLEFQARLREVQEMRDTAERERRETERNLLNTQHDLAELRRTLESVQEDLLLYKGQVAKVEKEKSALSAQIAFAGHSSAAVGAVGAALTDEDVHRALAVAAMKKRGGSSLSMLDAVLGGASSTDSIRTNVDQNKAGAAADATAGEAHEAKEALDLYEALTWDGNWELGQLREALATAAMDLELAETRCQQMAEQVEQYRTSLHQISEERDVLLEEGIALRGRVTHVQTIFAKQQLQAYRAAARGGSSSDSSGLIAFSIRGLRSHEAAMCRALGIADLHAPVSFFFTLDGLAEYETMMGPTLHALSDVVDVRFQYDDLAKDAVTLAVVEHTVFTFQLHCVCGDESRLVAMAELPGVALLAARELPREETLSLVDGAGETVGAIFIEFCCTRLMLPVLLDAPLSDPKAASVTLSAAEIKSAMVTLRTVRFLRIQVFDANGLAGSAEDNTLPQPYVFYTASSPLGGLNCVRDTVVQPINKAFTTDPKFDVAPVDHRVVVDPSLIRFIAFGTVCFVVFDERAKEVQMNLGIVEVALRPLLESPVATIITTQPLHPQGTLRVGLSWVSGA